MAHQIDESLAELNGTDGRYNTIQQDIIQYSTTQYNTIKISYNTVQYHTIQYHTIQYDNIQLTLTLHVSTFPSAAILRAAEESESIPLGEMDFCFEEKRGEGSKGRVG